MPKSIYTFGRFMLIYTIQRKKTVNKYISYFSNYNLVPLRDNYLPKNKNSCNFAA